MRRLILIEIQRLRAKTRLLFASRIQYAEWYWAKQGWWNGDNVSRRWRAERWLLNKYHPPVHMAHIAFVIYSTITIGIRKLILHNVSQPQLPPSSYDKPMKIIISPSRRYLAVSWWCLVLRRSSRFWWQMRSHYSVCDDRLLIWTDCWAVYAHIANWTQMAFVF